MDLKKFLPGHDEKDSREYYWALAIEPGWIQAGIWRIQDQKAQIIFSGPPCPWEIEEDLVSAADTALSSAIQNYPEDLTEPTKTVFGVVSSWVAEGQIKEENLEKIKKICAELSLKPLGFVVMAEAIAHFVKSEEGSALNAVVIGIYKNAIELSVFKLGNLLGSTSVARSISVADDVVEGLTRFSGGDLLPSRFILYDGKEAELEDARQELTTANWDELGRVKFLHPPKIEILEIAKKIRAVSLAGASELAEVNTIAEAPETKAETVEPTAEKVEDIPATPKEFGFVVNEDIAKDDQKTVDVEPNEVLSEEDALPQGEEVNNVVPLDSGSRSFLKPKSFGIKEKLMSGTSFLGNLKPKLAKPRIPAFGVGNKTFLFGIVFFVLILIAGFVFWWFYPKATVTIYVSPQRLEERVEILVDPSATEINLGDKVIPGERLESSIKGEKTKSTTGTKTVGDRAKGEVTLYRVGPQLTLPAGTVLQGPDSLRFTLDSETQVASGSAGSAGTVKANITAGDIGAQYNLASGATFKVGNYSTSDIEGKNESSFSGGSSREISAVSDSDQSALLSDLINELENKAKEELKTGLPGNKLFIDDAFAATSSSEVFSAKVGDEASTLKLDLTLDVTAISVDNAELVKLAEEVLKGKIPEGFVLRGEQINVDFDYKDEDDGKYAFEGRVGANLLPAIDPNEVGKKISGKYPALAEEFLTKEISGFTRAEIKLRPAFPGRLGVLPRIVKNIEVEISAER